MPVICMADEKLRSTYTKILNVGRKIINNPIKNGEGIYHAISQEEKFKEPINMKKLSYLSFFKVHQISKNERVDGKIHESRHS